MRAVLPYVSLMYVLCFVLCAKNDVHRVFGNHIFFVGRDDEDADFGIFGRDFGNIAAFAIGFFIKGNAQVSKAFDDKFSDQRAVFADAGRKDNGVDAAKDGDIGTDKADNAVNIGIQGISSTLFDAVKRFDIAVIGICLLYTSPSPRD